MATKPLLVIVGETASGKSQLALDLAKRFNGEIVSADSWAVYKDFDIGTAKPSKKDQNAIKHHLIDVVDAKDGFNAALYQKLANKAIDNIQSRGKLPILVGGTGLYIDSVIYDYGFLPSVSNEERARRNIKSLTELLEEAKNSEIDLSSIDTRNKRRVIRALESGGRRPTNQNLRSNTLIIGLRVDRGDLKKHINKRVEQMLKSGLETEVRQLAEKYGWNAEPLKGIGYYEWRDYFEGTQSLEQTKERIIVNSLKLTKRQRTWFKRNNSIQWVSNPSKAVDITTTFLNTL